MLKKYIECGKIVGTHGVHGEVRVQPWCDEIEFLKGFKKLYLDENGKTEVVLISCRPNKNVAVMKFRGVESIEQAEQYREKIIYIKRSDAKIEKGSYFITDLLGCRVFDNENSEIEYGKINDVLKTGANDVWSVSKDGKDVLIPVIPQIVKSVDVENEIIKISPIKGLFDDED